MALAFRRAVKEAEEAAAGYFSQFKDYYGFETDKPIEFDWESAKAVQGESKFNCNEEVLPRSITIVNCIKSSPNYLSGMVSNIPYKATDAFKELAFGLMRKHVRSIMMHFDDKSPKDGECTWTCEVKDGVLHATMHFSFSSYCGRQNYEDVCTFLWDYLDDHENLSFELEKAKIKADTSNYQNFNSDSAGYISGELGKEFPVNINWDLIRDQPGRAILYSNQPPVRVNYLLLYTLNDGRQMYAVRDILYYVLKDDMGKEAFADTFNELRINAVAAPAHKLTIVKEGKALVFNFAFKMDDHQNFGRSFEAKDFGKLVENLL